MFAVDNPIVVASPAPYDTGGCRQAFLSYGLFASFDFRQDNVKNLFYDPNIGSFRVFGLVPESYIVGRVG